MKVREGTDYFVNGLCIHCHIAKSELFEFREFDNRTETAWEVEYQKDVNKINDAIETNPENDEHEIVEYFSYDLHQSQIKFPKLHREASVIILHNFLEIHLNDLCGIIYDSLVGQIKLRDLKGNGIQRAYLFLSKVAGFNLQALNTEWEYIQNFSKLRNIIVHNASRLSTDTPSSFVSFISQSEHLRGDVGGSLSIRKGFIDDVISKLLIFFKKLDNEIQDFIQENPDESMIEARKDFEGT